MHYQNYAEGRTRTGGQREDDLARAGAQKMDLAWRLARVLGQSYDVRKVYLFGSLARGDGMHQSSDIDLAVEGLAPDLYFRALAELWDLLPAGVELDLVPLELASPQMLDAVTAEGALLAAPPEG